MRPQSYSRSFLLIFITFVCAHCTSTSHQTVPAKMGKVISAEQMEALIDQPGPVEFKTIATADWTTSLGGLLNLDSPKAKASGVKDRDEDIQIYTHLIKHPTKGLYIVDTGVARKLANDPSSVGVSWLVQKGMHLEKLRMRQGTGEALQADGAPLRGVLLTHMHIDHLTGMPDIPNDIPIYSGPGEGGHKQFINVVVHGTTNALLQGKPEIQEFQFSPDASGRFEGVLDLFEDGTVFVIKTPGHTRGSVSYVVRTTEGPVLLTGDTCHTRWGWENGVEPGDFTHDRELNLKNLLALKELVARHPKMIVRLGHQP